MYSQRKEKLRQPPANKISGSFGKTPVPLPRTKKHTVKKPVPTPRTKIEQTEPTFTQKEQALRGFTRSYEISLVNKQDPFIQLLSTHSVVKNNLLKILNEMKGFKFNETLKITFKKHKGDELIENEVYFNTKPRTVTNEIEIAELLQITHQQIIYMIQQWIAKGSGWTIQSVDGHFINIHENGVESYAYGHLRL